MGCVPQLVTAVWVGGDERDIHFNSTAIGQGSAIALPIWALYMRRVYANKALGYDPNREFDRPANKPGVQHHGHYGGGGGNAEKEGEEEGNENLMEGEGGEQPKPASKSSGEKYFE